MGIYSTFVHSWKKSFRLRRLQLKIAPPDQTVDDGNPEEDKALEDLLDLCEDDDGIRKLMEIESLSRSDLKEFYHRLCRAGLGQWVKGHYVALSTIAYGEPLLFLVRAERAGMSLREISPILLRYWSNEIPQGGLLRAVTKN